MRRNNVLKIIGACAIALVCVLEVNAQQEVVAAGGSFTSSDGSVSFTLGQVAFTFDASSAGNVSRGVQQSYPELEIGVPEFAPNLDYHVFPNPTRGIANLHLPNTSSAQFSVQIFDLSGRLVEALSIPGGVTQLDFSAFASGAYSVQLYEGYTRQAQFIIVKTN